MSYFSTAILFTFNFVCKYVQLEMQCVKICQHGHCEVIVSLTSHEQKEAISPTGAVEQVQQFQRPPDQCSLYGA